MLRFILVLMMLTKESYNQRLILAGNNTSPLIPNKSRVRLSCVTEHQWFFCMWYSPSSDVQCAIQHDEPRSVCNENPRIELEGGEKYCDITIQVEPEDHGQWLCVVNDLITFDAKKKYVNINVAIEASLELSIDGGEVEDGVLTAEEGSVIDIRCESGYGFPSPSLTWFGPPRPDLNNTQHNSLKVFQAFESENSDSHTVAVKQSVRYIPSTDDTNKTISCSMLQAMDGITHHTRTISQRLNITRRVVSPGGPLIQGVSILSGLILLLIIVILSCSLIVALVIRQQTKKKREEKLLQMKEEQYSLVHEEHERHDDCESTPRCYSQRPQINPRVQNQNLQYHEYRNKLSDCAGNQQRSADHLQLNQSINSSHPPAVAASAGCNGQRTGNGGRVSQQQHQQGAFIPRAPSRQLINPAMGRDNKVIMSPTGNNVLINGHNGHPGHNGHNGHHGHLTDTLEAISRSGVPIATGQTVLTVSGGQQILPLGSTPKNGNAFRNKHSISVNPGSPNKEMAMIHTSESGHSSGYEGEYQEPYAGSPVQGCRTCDIVRAHGRAPGSDSPGSRTADQSFESRCGGESPDSVAQSSMILRSSAQSPESLQTGTTYPMYRGSSGAQTPDSMGAGPSTYMSSAPHSKHSTLSAQVSRGGIRTPDSMNHPERSNINTPDRSNINTPDRIRMETAESRLAGCMSPEHPRFNTSDEYQSPTSSGRYQTPDSSGRYQTPESSGRYQSPASTMSDRYQDQQSPGSFVGSQLPSSETSGIRTADITPDLSAARYRTPDTRTPEGYYQSSPEHQKLLQESASTPESTGRFATPDSGRFPVLSTLPGGFQSPGHQHSSSSCCTSGSGTPVHHPLSYPGSPGTPGSGSTAVNTPSYPGSPARPAPYETYLGTPTPTSTPVPQYSQQQDSDNFRTPIQSPRTGRISETQESPTRFQTQSDPRKSVKSPEYDQHPQSTNYGVDDLLTSPTEEIMDRFGRLRARDTISNTSSIGGHSDLRSPLQLSGSDLKSSRSGTKSFEIDCDTDTDVHLGYSQGYSTDQSSLPKRYRRSRSLSASDLSISYSAEDLTKSCRLLSSQYAVLVKPGSVPDLEKLPVQTLVNPATKSLANLHANKPGRRRRSKTGPTSKSTNSVFECEEGCFKTHEPNKSSQQVSINMGPVVL